MSAAPGLAGRAIRVAERGWLPDAFVATGIRRLLRSRVASLDADTAAVRRHDGGRLAVETAAANRQHYEVPTEFFRHVLGPHLKYSCCLWSDARTLAEAERRMIDRSIERAGLGPGQRILDLGCGWGSLALDAAARFPDSHVLAVSNSATQIAYVEAEAKRRRLTNLEARRADVNDFSPERRFDRILSVEMMEHVRDHAGLMRRISGWLAPEGRLFVHVFCHRSRSYLFEDDGPGDWMARQFFTGGMMPSRTTIPDAAREARLGVEDRWTVSGQDYARTADAWLDNLDAARGTLAAILADAGEADPGLALGRWRLFFLAVRETFDFAGGTEWHVAHYRFRPETDG